jgi:PAS domain S-box-containing protein
MPERSSRLLLYALAVGSVAVATALRLALDPALGTRFPFATLFFAVLFSAWLGGFGPALLASACGALASMYFLLPPRQQLSLGDAESASGLVLYLAVSVGIAAIGGAMQRARQRAETEARGTAAQREALRVTLQSIGDAVITTDVAGAVTSMNAVACELTGWTPEAAAGRPLDEIFRILDEQTREPAPNPALRALAEGRAVGLANHTVLIARDGSERPIDDSAAPIRDRDETVRGVVLVFRDVSERRRTEARISRSEQELTDLFDNANVGLHFMDADGTILRANRAELEMLGYAHDEYVGRRIEEFHVDPGVADILARLRAGEALVGQPARLRCKNGAIKDVLINASIAQVDGRFAHTRCFTLDVTELNRAAEAQALLAAVVESSDDAVVTKTLEGVITSWNAGAERLFGWTSAEAVGRPITLIIPPERHDEEREILARLARGERIDAFDTVRIAKSGRRIDVSLRISPVRDRHGRIVGASKVARDVTAARRAERALRESEERFRQLATNAPAAIFVKDLAGRYTLANPLAREALGRDDTVIGLSDHDLLPADVADAMRAIDREVIASGRPIEVEEVVRREGFDRRYLSVKFPLFDGSGAAIGVCGVAIDITHRHAAEEALKAADRRKDEFLATLAHELRNPLAPLRTGLEIVKRAAGDVEQMQRVQAIMDRQLAHLERLVDDLLDVARISNDRLALRRERIELAPVIEQAVEGCRPLVAAAGLELRVDVPSEPIALDADAIRLGQVFSNLLHNACKYTEAGGKLTLEVSRDGDAAVVCVRDTGRGIPPEMQSRIFDMFTQVEPSSDQTQSGLGIGLTLVRRLVELHGGSVGVRSAGAGRGSEFVVRLPLVRGPAVEAADAPPAARAGAVTAAPRRVLVVDDNADAAESLATLLRLCGHETALVHDGEAAIEAAEKFRPDLVLLDLGLPNLNGHDVARRIREQPWGRDMVLVALTGWGQESDRRKSREVGFDHHLVKPVEFAVLTELLAKCEPRSGTDG